MRMNNSAQNFSCSMYSNSHVFFAFEASFTFLFSTLALMLNSLIVIDLLKFCKSMPDTIRLMALNFSIAYVFHSCYFVYKAIYELTLFISDFQLPISRRACIADVACYFIFLHIGHLSFFLLGIDQLCSKLWNKSFISTSSHKAILRNSFFIWTTPAVAYFGYTFYDSSNLDKLNCYCQASTAIPNTFIYQFISYFVISVQIVTCLIYGLVYHLNRKHFDDRRDQGLTTRHNVWSNIQATKWLLPVAIFHSILSASIIFMSIMNNTFKFMSSPADFLKFSWAVYLLFSFDRFMHPILAVRFSPSLQNGIRKLWPQDANFLVNIMGRLIVGSWKLGTDGDSNVVTFVSVDGQNLKKTGGEFQHVINYSITPEMHDQLLTDMWKTAANKKKKINPRK